jgi:hypothetical protein
MYGPYSREWPARTGACPPIGKPGGWRRSDAVRVVAMEDESAAGTAASADWHEQRRRAIAGHAAALEAGQAAEAAQAAELLAEFVKLAGERGLAPTMLSARSFDGRSTYRTRVRGWYLKSNRTVAVGADGGYYVLAVPSSLRARLSGADLQPSIPKLVVGAGGGDGETIPLAQLLRRRLDLGASWP